MDGVCIVYSVILCRVDNIMLKRHFIYVQIVLLIECLLVTTCFGAYEDSDCKWGDSQPGICRKVKNCRPAFESVLEKKTHDYPRCGFVMLDEIVCCPVSEGISTSTKVCTANVEDKRPIRIGAKSSLRKAEQECQKYSKDVPQLLVPHIIGGELAGLGEFPHMAALGYLIDGILQFNCGGALISYDYVLTAGHCIQNAEGIMPTTIRIGTININDDSEKAETDFEVAEIITHPEYKRPAKYHDIALIKLARKAKISLYIRPVCLYSRSANPEGPMIVTGWGTTSIAKRNRSDDLLKANLTAVDISECNVTYEVLMQGRKLPKGIIEGQICAVDRAGKRDSCQGDSGGPLQVSTDQDEVYEVVGITSFGLGCGSTRPSVYTRVSGYLDWIENIVWPA